MMVIDWGKIIEQGITTLGAVLIAGFPLWLQQRKIARRVDGHLSKLTESLAKEAKTNVALSIENDRVQASPEAFTPESGAHVTRDSASGVPTVHERRKPE